MAQKMTNENKPFVMSTLSGVAYKDLEEAKETFNYWRFTEHMFIDRDGAQCYLIWNDDDAVVIFRGTEPNQWSDIKADLNAFKRRGRYKHGYVHGGFQGELDKIWDELDTQLSVLEDRNVHVTGHSLGGAMATICASRLRGEPKGNIKALYTYGSPKVGGKLFVWGIDELTHYRHVNNNDMVTRVPLWIMGYRHHGNLTYINHYGNIRSMTSWQRFKDKTRGRWTAIKKFQFFDGIRDHDINKYCKKLKGLK